MLAEHPDALILGGGTDLMVEINDGHRRPDDVVIAVGRIPDLRSWRHDPAAGTLTIGAAVTYTRAARPSRSPRSSPALAEASRTVGSPQIRNAGTLAGNLGTCSPAGDGAPGARRARCHASRCCRRPACASCRSASSWSVSSAPRSSRAS